MTFEEENKKKRDKSATLFRIEAYAAGTSEKFFKTNEHPDDGQVDEEFYKAGWDASRLEDREYLKQFLPDWDCGDSSCRFAKKKGGMRTNGGCRCLQELPGSKRMVITRIIMAVRNLVNETK